MEILARLVLFAILLWVIMEQSNRNGNNIFMGRAPCICDENTVYVVQARNHVDESPFAKRRKIAMQIVPGLILIILVLTLVHIIDGQKVLLDET